MKRALVLVAIAGCASGTARPDDASVIDAKTIDGGESFVDAAVDAPLIDAPPIDGPMIDAPMIDAPMIDAPMIDAPPDACVPVVTELLVNPVFDLSPAGTGWQQTLIDPAAPLVTSDDGIAEHTAPYKAWLGGIEADTGAVTDVLWQDVTVPAGTTQLVLTGYYEVRTSETTTTTPFDTASFDLTMTNGTQIQNLRTLSNLTPTTTWTVITHTFAQNLSGQAVRLRMTSSNDFLNASSFYFDTLSLRATHCP